MNREHTPGHEHADVPEDLREVASLLGVLGEAERRAADEELEHRVLGASLEQLHRVEATHAMASEAGAAARAAGDPGLEDRVHHASATNLNEPGLRLVGIEHAGGRSEADRARAHRGNLRRRWVRAVSVAAALALVGGASWTMLRQGGIGPKRDVTLAMSTDELKKSVSNDLDLLLSVVGDSGQTESASTADTEINAEWLDEVLGEGRAS